MIFKAEEERNVLQSCCLIRAIFLGLLCTSGSPCSPASERSRGSGGNPAQEARQPPAPALFGNRRSRRWGPPRKVRQHRQAQGCKGGDIVEVAASHGVGGPFSQKVTPIRPLHSPSRASSLAVHFFLLWCSKKYDCLGEKEPCTFFSSWVHEIRFTWAFGKKGCGGKKLMSHTRALILLLPHILYVWQKRTDHLNFRLVFSKGDKNGFLLLLQSLFLS